MKSVINTKLIQSPEDFVEMLYPYGMKLPVEKDMASLKLPLTIGRKTIPNRICIQPLEGFDSNEDGSPTELVHRRYTRFARSGAGLVWFESVSVSDDGKSNPRQMMLSRSKIPQFRALLEEMDRISLEEFGYRQYKVLQLTHSGRVSRGPDWTPKPLAARLKEADLSAGI